MEADPKKIKFENVYNDWLRFLKNDEMRSRTTSTTYGSYLRRYRKWLCDRGMTEPSVSDALCIDMLQAYQYDLAGRGFAKPTIRAAFDPIKGLAKRLMKLRVLGSNPTDALTLPSRPKKVTAAPESVTPK